MSDPRFDALLRHASELWNCPQKQILARDRHKTVTQARHAAQWVIRQTWGKSLPELGRMFENRDHTTALSAIRRIAGEVAKGTELGAMALELQKRDAARAVALDNGPGIHKVPGIGTVLLDEEHFAPLLELG